MLGPPGSERPGSWHSGPGAGPEAQIPTHGLPRVRIGADFERCSKLFPLALLPLLAAALDHVRRGPQAAEGGSLLILSLASCAWAGAVFLAARGLGDLRIVLAGALGLRLLLLAATPTVSDDIERYVWEGAVIESGRSPYAWAPADPELADLRRRLPEVAARVNHPEVSAAYPPLAQAAFALVVRVTRPSSSDTPTEGAASDWGRRARSGLRVFFGLADLLVLLPLVQLLRRLGRPPSLAVAWGWSPLAAVAFSAHGHLDSLAILALVCALALWPAPDRPGRGAAGALVMLSASIATKIVPLLLLPVLMRGRRQITRGLIVGAMAGACFLPLLALEGGSAGWARGLTRYGLHWEGGSLVLRWIRIAVERSAAAFDFARPMHDLAWLMARIVVALLALLVLTSMLRARAPRRLPARLDATGRWMGALLVLSPTLHPWYWTWMLPFFALRPRASWAWLLITAPLGYWPVSRWKAEALWYEPSWIWVVQAVPFALLWGREAWREAHD